MKELMPAQPGDAGTLCFSPLGALALVISGACLTASVLAATTGSVLLCLSCVLVTAGLWIVAAHDSATVLLRLARHANSPTRGGQNHGG